MQQPLNEHEFEAIMLSMHMTANKYTNWYINSSATNHVIGDSGSFQNVRNL